MRINHCTALKSNLTETIKSITLRRLETVELVAEFSKMEVLHGREIKSNMATAHICTTENSSIA